MINDNKTSPKAIQDKLTNLVQVNARDYCVKSKLSKNHIDVFRFFDPKDLSPFYSDPRRQIIDFNKNLNQSDIEYYLENASTPNEFLSIINKEGLSLAERKVKLLHKDFVEYKNIILKEFSNSGEQKRKFLKVNQYARDIQNDTGVWSLFLAHFFLTGPVIAFDNKLTTVINAPLLFYPVEIQEFGRKIALKKREDKFIINEKLFSFLKKQLNTDWDIKEILKIKDINELISLISESLQQKIKINPEPAPFDITVSKVNQQTDLEVYNNSVLGIYEPSGGRLKSDLEVLVTSNIDPFAKDNKISDKKFIEDEIKGSDIVEIGRPLNIYQRYAIRSSLMQDTVIYGPPGTGKSEVIANIIANAVVAIKSILVVSEKKAALDVLHDRLGAVGSLAIFLYDLDDKESFYKKIAELGNKVGMFWTENHEFDNFDIKNKIVNESDYQTLLELQKELRKEIVKILNLYTYRDSKNHDFHDYAKARMHLTPTIINQARSENLVGFIEGVMNKYFISDVDKLFEEVERYKNFLYKYGLDSTDVSEKLKAQKIQLTKYQTKNNIIGYLTKNRQVLENKIADFQNFLNKHNLISNEEFINLLKNDHYLLERQLREFKEFYQKYGNLLQRGFYGFLTSNYDKLQRFLDIYNAAKDNHKEYILNKFLTQGVIEEKKPLFGGKAEVDLNHNEKLNAIKDYLKIEHSEYNYLLDFISNEELFSEEVVFIFLNKWLLAPYIEELNNTNFIFFDSDMMIRLKNMKLSQTDFNLILDVLTYEAEILAARKNLIMTDFNVLLSQLRKADEFVAKNSAKKIEKLYFEYIRFILQQKRGVEQERIKEVLKISNNEKKLLPSIQKFVNEYHDELRLLFPIWISKPELVAEMIPLKQDFFNYGIFDEASQMYVEKAYPLVYRTQISIVAGDDKQLKPTSFFAGRFDTQGEDYALSDMDQVDSLLDRAKVSLWSSFNLRNHYRSAHKDLIRFSNEFIYDKKLNFASYNGIKGAGIEVINVNGTWDNINEEEAKVAVRLVLENIDKYDKILVVTFGIKQSEYIEDLILKYHENNQRIFDKLRSNQLVITNLENVQGNEADLVILSVSYAKNPDGILTNKYGPLIMYGGANRLNVAITRAREKMIILKSLTADEMSVNIDNPNAVIFKSFINFCDNFVKDNEEAKEVDLEAKRPLHASVGRHLKALVYNEDWNCVIKENYDIGSEILDFAIIHPDSNKVIAAIIVSDTFKYLSAQKVLENIDKFYFVEDRGFKTVLVEEHEWVANQINILNIIKAMVENQISKRRL